jgi:hypothetical protein
VNVTASKIMLGLSLAAYGYCSWDHIFPDKAAPAAPPGPAAHGAHAGASGASAKGAPAPAGKELTAGMVNRNVVLKLERDPFNSVPLGQTLITEGALPNEPGKDLGELNLQGVMITFAERAVVINGRTLHEGQTMQTSTGATIRCKRIGVGHCIVEGAGHMVMLKVDDALADSKKEAGKAAAKDAAKLADPKKPEPSKKTAVAGVNPHER